MALKEGKARQSCSPQAPRDALVPEDAGLEARAGAHAQCAALPGAVSEPGRLEGVGCSWQEPCCRTVPQARPGCGLGCDRDVTLLPCSCHRWLKRWTTRRGSGCCSS